LDDENDQSATKDAFDVLGYIASKRLAAGRLTVVDATNVQGPGEVLGEDGVAGAGVHRSGLSSGRGQPASGGVVVAAEQEHCALGLEALDRLAANEPLWRIHEPVFAILALESEPVDPRL
jgi:hypothetical protein